MSRDSILTGENCAVGSGLGVEVARHHLPDIKVQGYTKARLQHMVDISPRCDYDFLRPESYGLRVAVGCMYFPSAVVTFYRIDVLDTRVLLGLGAVVLC